MSMELLTAQCAAGEVKTFFYPGDYFEVVDAAYPFDVQLCDASLVPLSALKAVEASFFVRPKSGFKTIMIQSAQAQTIRFYAGSGDAGTRRVSSSVSVIDASYLEVRAGRVFKASMTVLPVAGQYGHGSIKNTGADLMEIVELGGMGSAALAVYYGTFVPGVPLANLNATQAFPMSIEQAAPVADPGCELRNEANAAQRVINVLDFLSCGPAPDRDFLKRSIILKPGATLMFVASGQNLNMFISATYNRRPL